MISIVIKIQDVAKKAGVSTATVSRVINGYEHVSDKLKNRVQDAIDELNYKPNQIAKSLASQKTNLIGILVPDLKYEYYANMLSSIEEYASQKNYNIIVCNIKEDLDKEIRYINILKEMWVDGIILMHEKLNDNIKKLLLECEIPTVLASIKLEGLDFPSVNIDDFKAAYDATKYLIDLGHRKIAIIAGDMRDYTAGSERFRGYKQALVDNDIAFVPKYFGQGNFNIQDGYNAMGKLLENEIDLPTAVFAVSDSMAVGAMNYMIDRGYNVPDDISIIGFDDIDLASAVRPKLTTINQPAEKIGSLAVELLIKYIEKEYDEHDKEIVLEHRIVARGTCKELL
ncbi:LacI family DNA-binding transcriptional regulator [Wukongibacter baidiensis]|uniref:LacI family DNA-binding transcriptional regulator n=1 Tax=Wukongibacter baidiensis TaxID=1723361 RepID=UPI003D7F4532